MGRHPNSANFTVQIFQYAIDLDQISEMNKSNGVDRVGIDMIGSGSARKRDRRIIDVSEYSAHQVHSICSDLFKDCRGDANGVCRLFQSVVVGWLPC